MKINDLFKIHNAKSKGFENYDNGTIPFISNGVMNNGVVGFVSPFETDRVFRFRGICVSAFCDATVQDPPFIPRGNGGSGLTVLEPKSKMNKDELLYYSAYINKALNWRFSFGRMVTEKRFRDLEIIPYINKDNKKIDKSLPKNTINPIQIKHNSNFKLVNIEKLFTLHRGDFHALDRLDLGKYPTVSRVAFNNGIVGYYDKPENAKLYPKHFITVSSVTGDAFVQLHDFISTDNVVICEPKYNFKITTLFFIQFMLNNVKWRWSYGRQCYKTKFATTNIHLPVMENQNIDEDYIEKLVKNSPYWNQIDDYINSNN